MIALLKIVLRNIIFLTKGEGLSVMSKVKLKLTKRFQEGEINLYKRKFKFSDSSSFVSMYEEIFIKGIYKFKSQKENPVILDCGSNVGLSVINFKKQFPKAKITAFEPDVKIYESLVANINAQGFSEVEAVNKAVWIHNDKITFQVQGGLSGSIAETSIDSASQTIEIPCIRLADLLDKEIDFLKIDIEGAEFKVIQDCKDKLKNVKLLFVEYHSFEQKPQVLDQLLELLSAAGFRYHIQEAYSSPQPFMKVEALLGMDLQLNIFCYRT